MTVDDLYNELKVLGPEKAGRVAVELVTRTMEDLANSPKATLVDSCSFVLPSTFRSQPRLACRDPLLGRDQEAGALADRSVCQAGRERCPHTSTHSTAPSVSHCAWSGLSETNRRCVEGKSVCSRVPKVNGYTRHGRAQAQRDTDSSVPVSLSLFLFVEVFAGSGELSKAMSRNGFTVILWDILMGPTYDLTKHDNQMSLRRILLNAQAVHLARPATASPWQEGVEPQGMPSSLWESQVCPVQTRNVCVLVIYCSSLHVI